MADYTVHNFANAEIHLDLNLQRSPNTQSGMLLRVDPAPGDMLAFCAIVASKQFGEPDARGLAEVQTAFKEAILAQQNSLSGVTRLLIRKLKGSLQRPSTNPSSNALRPNLKGRQ